MSPGCRAELPHVITYKGSDLSHDLNSGYWTVFNTEWVARVAVWVLWDLYDTHRLWYVPRKLREDMRGLRLDYVLGSRENEQELHRLLSVIDSIDWRKAEFMYTKKTMSSFEDTRKLAPGDYVWYDPWRRERVSMETARQRREHRTEMPSNQTRGFVYCEHELHNANLEVSNDDGSSGFAPVNDGTPGTCTNMYGAPSSSGGIRRRSVGVSSFGPVIRTMRQTEALDLSVPENYHTIRVFLRDCGVDVNEVPRSGQLLKDWMTGRLNRPRTILCGNCVAGLCDACYTGYRNGDPARIDAVMDVDAAPMVGDNQAVGSDNVAPDSEVEGVTAAF